MTGCTSLLDAVGKTILDFGYRLSQATEDARPGKVTKELIKHSKRNIAGSLSSFKDADSIESS